MKGQAENTLADDTTSAERLVRSNTNPTPTGATHEGFVGAEPVLDHLNIKNRGTLATLIRDHGLPCYLIGGSRRFILSEVDEWAAAQRVSADPSTTTTENAA